MQSKATRMFIDNDANNSQLFHTLNQPIRLLNRY